MRTAPQHSTPLRQERQARSRLGSGCSTPPQKARSVLIYSSWTTLSGSARELKMLLSFSDLLRCRNNVA